VATHKRKQKHKDGMKSHPFLLI